MHTLICAAGTQNRWERSGGTGLKQLIEIDGQPIIHRLYRQACRYSDHVVTLVRDPSRPEWEGLNPAAPAHEDWMGEMGKFLDGEPYWPEQGEVTILYGDAFYTEATLERIYSHRPALPTVYGTAQGSRLESFAFRFAVEEAETVKRIARECAERDLHRKGGPWRWHYWRCTGRTDYHVSRLRRVASEEQGWLELPRDATEDFDKTSNLREWRERFAPRRTARRRPMRYAKRDLFGYDGGVRRLLARAGRPIPDRFAHLVGDEDVSSRRTVTPAAPAAEQPVAAATAAGASPQASTEEPVDYTKLKQPQLKELLEARGIDYPKGPVRNATLIALLEAEK